MLDGAETESLSRRCRRHRRRCLSLSFSTSTALMLTIPCSSLPISLSLPPFLSLSLSLLDFLCESFEYRQSLVFYWRIFTLAGPDASMNLNSDEQLCLSALLLVFCSSSPLAVHRQINISRLCYRSKDSNRQRRGRRQNTRSEDASSDPQTVIPLLFRLQEF